ncbi:hypothetical protein IWZ01DRAFT_153349 [Phyllosticta capitalensis]
MVGITRLWRTSGLLFYMGAPSTSSVIPLGKAGALGYGVTRSEAAVLRSSWHVTPFFSCLVAYQYKTVAAPLVVLMLICVL